MNRFSYTRAKSVADAVRLHAVTPNAEFLAGGTNLVDLMRENVMRPAAIIDITRLPLREIEATQYGALRIGALVSNSTLAWDTRVIERYPLLAAALLAGACAQIRNAATVGGNLLQRTRCLYFYDPATSCNKRVPGTGCAALDGVNRMHAIFGASEDCIATHPSDMCVALAALDASLHVAGRRGIRTLPFDDLHRLPGHTPHRETTLADEELITAIEVPSEGYAQHFSYLKLRDRQSYAFALVSVALGVRVEKGAIRALGCALGGVAHKPWRDRDAETLLIGRAADDISAIERYADGVVAHADPRPGNEFKVDLARRAIVRAFERALAPDSAPLAGRDPGEQPA
ncbi:FAD binding domain-containing protein [Paraburkholderia unamae]|uniref:Xanthine dehydrogenase YagS FAD-binding subunit n=1 Tax=Paraburkholderia unamae TaxID=219649 RepID=A0ABX5KB38_9BURK|nr:xanthine dehydrogenase family protein subunit M [Paraburkholderia unamae]PVX61380.1 xanthine dehydrogenase YagS FAD-binding subunit [Paraburkholderia unamae]RAR49308.1 xanthine dehydrogenase YagS FAD-binding subunit [Paraburkholderia unamae]